VQALILRALPYLPVFYALPATACFTPTHSLAPQDCPQGVGIRRRDMGRWIDPQVEQPIVPGCGYGAPAGFVRVEGLAHAVGGWMMRTGGCGGFAVGVG
jgi:hypothetical protein